MLLCKAVLSEELAGIAMGGGGDSGLSILVSYIRIRNHNSMYKGGAQTFNKTPKKKGDVPMPRAVYGSFPCTYGNTQDSSGVGNILNGWHA